MSPPPRHEAMDYMTSRGTKKKNHTRGASTLSPAGGTGQRVQSPAIEPPDIDIAGSVQSIKQPEEVGGTVSTTISKTLTLTDELQEHLSLVPQAAVPSLYDRPQASGGLPDKASSIESLGSPAVTALRRLSEVGLRRQSTGSPYALGLSNSLGGTIAWFKPSAEAIPQPRKQSMDGEDTSRSKARRRSSAFRDGNRRRPEKDNAKAAAPGLKLPATITLRKATGLFNTDTNADAKSDAVSDESPTSRNDSPESPTSCALIAFDSQQLDNPGQTSTSHHDAQIHKHSVISIKGLELAVKVPAANGSTSVRSWQQAGAAPVVTVTDVYPSPAILASPIKTTSFTDLPERRFSVVKIHSRKSVHRVIWCEDDGSCSNGASSDPVSPTGETSAGSVKSISPSENSPVRTLSASKVVSRQSFESTSYSEHSFPPKVLMESECNAPSSMSNLHPEGQMFQWLWGADLGSLETTAEPSNNAERPSQSASKLGSAKENPPAVVSWVPHLMVPDDEEPTAASGELTMRRQLLIIYAWLHCLLSSTALRPSFQNYYEKNLFEHPRLCSSFFKFYAPTKHQPFPQRARKRGSYEQQPISNGQCPLRHPRPLTAADLHMQLEKEQEAVVNRLTRELSLLRQQTASVASTTSSTSTGFADSTDNNANHLMSGASHPTPSRRHRSSSSLSTRSMNTTATTASGYTGLSGSTVGTTGGVAGSTISGIAPARDSHAVYPTHAQSLTRQNSTASSRRSQASSPSLSSSLLQGDHFPNLIPLRQPSLSQPHPPLGQLPQQTLSPAASARSSYVHSSAATARYEESAHQRAEMESVKRENETLRRRIRELERRLTSNRRHARSDSESTGTSALRRSAASAHGHDGSLDFDEDAVHVGESAGSVGVGGGH
ncbi:MAG: hypothetical protein Q9210_001071 [Variospora velana]